METLRPHTLLAFLAVALIMWTNIITVSSSRPAVFVGSERCFMLLGSKGYWLDTKSRLTLRQLLVQLLP